MGVRSLQSFLKNNQNILGTGILVANTDLVIDGNNLMCMLFVEFSQDRESPEFRNDIYDGNLVAFGEVIREFFRNLEKCSIKPVIVYDGSVIGREELKDFIATKEATVFKRSIERFERSRDFIESRAFESPVDIFLPHNTNVVFRSISREFGVKIIQTPYDADSHIARVANDLNCPVLTNDSDFIIYDLNKGFILLDTFDYKHPVNTKSGHPAINARLFSQTKLCKSLPGLPRGNLPLLSVLLGNDYVEPGFFDRILNNICGHYYNGQFEARTFNHRRIANLLDWLRNKPQREALDIILNQVPHFRRPKLEQCIQMFLRNYIIEQSDDFTVEMQRVYPLSRLPKGASTDQSPAKFLRDAFENNVLANSALDMIFKNTHYNYSTLDDATLPSANIVSFRPFSLALVLLRPSPYTNLSTYQRQVQSEKDAFHIFDRIKNEYSRVVIRPLESLENFGSLEHLDCYSMILLEPALKKKILMDTFRFNEDEFNLMMESLGLVFKEPAQTEACICFLLIKYITLEMKLAPKKQFVDALVLTHFYYAALNGHLNKTSIPDSDDFGQILLRLRPHARTNNKRDYDHSEQIYRRILHMISMLIAAYKGFNYINVLLNNVFPNARYDKWFNGALIFRLTDLMRSSKDTMDRICQNLEVLFDLSGSIRAQVLCEL